MGRNDHSSRKSAEMIAKGASHLIHNDDELEMYTDALFLLTAMENPSSSEAEAIELLILLVQRYEQEHYPIPGAKKGGPVVGGGQAPIYAVKGP